MEKTSKKKKITKKEFLKKLFKGLFLGYIVVMIAMFVINGLLKDERNIYKKIGSMEPYSISIKDALNIKSYGFETYVSYLKNNDTKSAYKMLTEEYKKIISYESYLKTLENINFDTFDMKEIKMKTTNTYVATIVYEKNDVDVETKYLFYLNEINPKIITISPDNFIYGYKNTKFKMDGVELYVEECIAYIDTVRLNATLKNTSLFETMEFTNIGVGYDESINKNENIDITLAPGEERELNIEYSTNYYIPNNVKLKRFKDEETLRTYTFYFEKINR